MSRQYALVSGAVFGLIAIGQALRAFNGLPVHVGDLEVPVWLSWIAAAVAASLCVWAILGARR